MSETANTLETDGRIWLRGALSETDISALEAICDLGAAPGVRISAAPNVIAALKPVTHIASTLLRGAQPVRLVAFNKSEAGNWSLPWHQDRVIAVRDRAEIPGYSNWTRKSGVWHVEPPIGLLERMVFLRVHIDGADAEAGCLEIASGTHAHGLVSASEAERIATEAGIESCIARRGDVLAAKALILHRSAASRRPVTRRALRIDYSADTLPSPLEWDFAA